MTGCEIERVLAHRWKAHQLRQQFLAHRQDRRRWDIIRKAYDLQIRRILAGRCDPYFLDWDFSPIEELAWQDIRAIGVPLYPQFPSCGYFIDFADPRRLIAVELDGKQFHDAERDARRDADLQMGCWSVFRIPGRNALKAPTDPRDEAGRLQPHEELSEFTRWGSRWSTGFFWALKLIYYTQGDVAPSRRTAAMNILYENRSPHIEFDIDPKAPFGLGDQLDA